MEKKVVNLLVMYFLLLPLFTIMICAIEAKAYIYYCLFLIGAFVYVGPFKINIRTFSIILFLCFFSLLSMNYYENSIYNWFGMFFLLFIYSVPWMLFTSKIKNWQFFLEKMKSKMDVYFIINIILFIYFVLDQKKVMGNMELSYSILPLGLFSIYYFMEKKNYKYLFFFIFSLATIIFYGSRGTLLCVISFVVFYLAFNFKENYKKLFLLFFMAIFLLYNYNSILDYTIKMTSNLGIYSRTLHKLKEGSILSDTGRSKIQYEAKKIISNHWLFGVGIGGDRPFINREVYGGLKDMNSCYPHNIILELLSDYGTIIGSFLLLLLFLKIILELFKGSYYKKRFIILLISMELIRLLVSSSYIRSPLFFILMGVLLSEKEDVRDEENIINCT